jgi:hypothetical protein
MSGDLLSECQNRPSKIYLNDIGSYAFHDLVPEMGLDENFVSLPHDSSSDWKHACWLIPSPVCLWSHIF